MKVKDLLQALLKVKDLESEVFVYSVDINPYNGMHELRDAGFAISAYEGEGGAFVVEGEMVDPDEWEGGK